MARRKPSKTKRNSDRRRKAVVRPAKDVESARGVDGDEDDDGPDDDLLDFRMSDDDIDSIDDSESWDGGYVHEDEDEDEEEEAFRRRRRIRDDELRWEEEALGDWREMESYRREYNDR